MGGLNGYQPFNSSQVIPLFSWLQQATAGRKVDLNWLVWFGRFLAQFRIWFRGHPEPQTEPKVWGSCPSLIAAAAVEW